MDPHDKAIIHGSNESDYRTPPELFRALNTEFTFGWDLAANAESALVGRGDSTGLQPKWLGPGSRYGQDALTIDWHKLAYPVGFINPPFSKTLMNAYNTGRIKVDGKYYQHELNPVKAGWYDIAKWAEKCWKESQNGATIVGVFPFAPQTDWYRRYVLGHGLERPPILVTDIQIVWNGHAAREERRIPHRISFLKPDGTPTGNAGVNSVILVWKPGTGIVGPWAPHSFYWSYRGAA